MSKYADPTRAPTEPLPPPHNIIGGVWYYSAEQMRAALATPAPVAAQIPANVSDNAACDSSVSHKAAPVAADTMTEPVTDEDVEAAILAAHGYEAPHVTRLYMRLALESFASRRAPARAIPAQEQSRARALVAELAGMARTADSFPQADAIEAELERLISPPPPKG